MLVRPINSPKIEATFENPITGLPETIVKKPAPRKDTFRAVFEHPLTGLPERVEK